MKLDVRSLEFKLGSYFVVFAILIMRILWVFQIIFLQTFYQMMKSHEIARVGNIIVDMYDEENFESVINEISYERGLSVSVYEENGKLVTSTFARRTMQNNNMSREINRLIQELKTSNKKSVSRKNEQPRFGTVLVYCTRVVSADGSEKYVCIDSPLAPVDATTKILQTQLIVVTIISLAFALILSYFIAVRLSKPIRKISSTAGELANGKYNVSFENGSYSEINQLASVLNYTAKRLGESDKMRRDLMANVSHDLKTPLTIIKSYAEMIRDLSGNNPEKRNEHTNVIIEETDRLTLLVNDILDLSKIESGAEIFKYNVFNFSDTVISIINRFKALYEENGYKFEFVCDSNLFVCGDEKRIEQVVYNLLINGINYTGEDKILFVSALKHENKVRFSVKDTGVGIPKDEIDKVWERYYKSSRSHTRTSCGSGIGLSIVKGILTVHKANFGIISKEGKGSEFWFELNCCKPDID